MKGLLGKMVRHKKSGFMSRVVCVTPERIFLESPLCTTIEASDFNKWEVLESLLECKSKG